VPLGTQLPVAAWLESGKLTANGRPVHFHFFNPTCPCSRFNLDHLHALVRKFGSKVYFVAVVESDLVDTKAFADIAKDLEIPWIADDNGKIAAAAGIYSTPQAVVTTADGALFYRGNYNLSRYCTDPKTEFARIALESLIAQTPAPASPQPAAYGCELPVSLDDRRTQR
jgi:hypothetical protein